MLASCNDYFFKCQAKQSIFFHALCTPSKVGCCKNLSANFFADKFRNCRTEYVILITKREGFPPIWVISIRRSNKIIHLELFRQSMDKKFTLKAPKCLIFLNIFITWWTNAIMEGMVDHVWSNLVRLTDLCQTNKINRNQCPVMKRIMKINK